MCHISRCCCCLSLKTGIFIAIGYTSVISLFAISVVIWMLTSGMDHIRQLAIDKMDEEYSDKYSHSQIVDAVNTAMTLERVVYIVSLVLYVVWMLFGLLMPVALIKQRRGFLMPWIVMTWIMTVLIILGLINYIRVFAKQSGSHPNPYVWVQLVLYGVTLTANACSICGVSSYYKNNLKEEREVAPDVAVSVQAPPACGQFNYKYLA